MSTRVPPGSFSNHRPRLLWIVLLAILGMLIAGLSEAAAASLVGKDGRIHVCYRAKGKMKGAMRMVRSSKARCKRGEKKAAWAITGPAGAAGETGAGGAKGQGTSGAMGATGTTGTTGTGGSSPSLADLEAKIAELTNRIKELEKLVPVVSALCSQGTALTKQVNAVGSMLDDTALAGVIPLGLALALPTPPAPLADPLTCP
jgi:hypothetical protein